MSRESGAVQLLHALVYVVLGILACRAAEGRGWALLLGGLVGSVYGAVDEFHQRFVPGRVCDLRDWIADTVGALVGALGWGMAKR